MFNTLTLVEMKAIETIVSYSMCLSLPQSNNVMNGHPLNTTKCTLEIIDRHSNFLSYSELESCR